MSKEKIQELDWEEIHIFINKPVYDKNIKKWRILNGYKRLGDSWEIHFTDCCNWEAFNGKKLYLKEV